MVSTTQPIHNFPTWLIPLCVPVLTTMLRDLQGFVAQRKTDKNATFDWPDFFTGIAIGAIVGFGAAMGQSFSLATGGQS